MAALEIVRSQVSARTLRDLVFTGRTIPVEEALELELVDEVVPAGDLVERAVEAARRYASIPREAYAATRRHLCAPALDRVARYSSELDPGVLELWSRPESLERIGRFLDQTVGKKG